MNIIQLVWVGDDCSQFKKGDKCFVSVGDYRFPLKKILVSSKEDMSEGCYCFREEIA